MSPVRIESGVHFDPAPSDVLLDDAVALFVRVEWICLTLDTAARGCRAQNLSMVAEESAKEWALVLKSK